MTKKHKTSTNDDLLRLLAPIPRKNHFRFQHTAKLTVSPEWHIEPRIIDDFHLLFVQGGDGTYWVDGNKVAMRRGLVVFLTNGVQYEATQNPDDPPEIIPIRFCRYDNITGKMNNWVEKPFYIICQTIRVSYFEELFESLRQCRITMGDASRDLSTAITCTILYELYNEKHNTSQEQDSMDHRVKQVGSWMADHPLDRSSLKSLSKRAALSPKYFTLQFKKHFNIPPKAYQVKLRLSHARYLLENSQLNVVEISELLGYPDPFVFSRQFKKIFKYPPTSFRS